MNMYSEEFLDEACETLVKAEEIQNNKDLMKELEPKMKSKGQKLLDMTGSLKQKYQSKLNEVVKEEQEESKVKGESALKDEKPKIMAKE